MTFQLFLWVNPGQTFQHIIHFLSFLKIFFFCGEPYEKLNCFTKTGDDDQVDNEVAGSSDKYSKVYFLLFLHLFVRLCALLVWLMMSMMMMMTMMAKKKQGQSPNFLAKYSVLGKTFLLKFHLSEGVQVHVPLWVHYTHDCYVQKKLLE